MTYTYDSATGNLDRADWSDGSFETYEYEDPNDDHNLTGVRDSYGHLIESHTYDALDRVTATQSDGGNSAYALVYNTATQTTVTNSLGVPSVFNHDSFSGMVTSSSGPGCTSCGGGGTSSTIARDRFLRPVTITDAEGIVTKLSYDAAGNVLTRTEAFGVPGVERTTTYTWDPTFNLPLTVSVPSVGTCGSPSKIVTNIYDPTTGDKLTEQITGCADNASFLRTTTWTYDAHGQVKSIDGPRTDVSDVTTYDYYADGDADPSRRGRLEKVTNALGHETIYSGYDLFSNVGSVTDPNSVETAYQYDERDRTTETRIKGAMPAEDIVTENHFDLEGNLDFERLPNCVEAGLGCAFSLDYVHDSVNRLTEIRDPFGNKIVYTHDTAGNRIREEYRDPAEVVHRFTNFAYDDYNRLQYTYFTSVVPEDPGAVFFKYSYFDDGQRHSERDPEGHVMSFTYDELKRLKTVTQTVGVDTLTTTYGYDVQGNLVSVTDPNGLVTTYTNHDMGWRLGVDSPDTGITSHGYDPAGNLTSTTNADGITTTRSYDALNRPTSISYPDAGLNVTHGYDSGVMLFGIGRRTGMTDASGSTVYGYERRGLLTLEEKTIGAATYVTEYSHDKTGNLQQILYPTDDPGLRQGQVDYTHDAADRVIAITAKVNGATTTVASSLAYKPFGPRTSLTFGNGLVDSRTYGTRYHLGSWTVGGLINYSHDFDDDLNMTSRTDHLNGANSRTFGFDEIHRLTQAAGPWGPGTACAGGTTYTYDQNSNRLCKGEASSATDYTYLSGTNRLDATTGGEPATYSYDASGNTTGDGTHSYQYSDADRLVSVDFGATATYAYDGDGRRVVKTVGSKTTCFFYDPGGRLLAETVPASGSGKDYLYLDDAPIGGVDWTTEQDLGTVLRVGKSPPNVHLDWTLYPSGSNSYVVRRKQVADPEDRTFDGAEAIVTVSDPTRIYDDPVLNDGNDYSYGVFRRALDESLYFYHTDHLGTPIAMTDGAGSFVWKAEHLSFGDAFDLQVSVVPNNLRFAGQYFDGETDIHQNWFRSYHANTGRYAEPDPMGLAPSPNLFLYVGGNPLRNVDPSGLAQQNYQIHMCCRPLQGLQRGLGRFLNKSSGNQGNHCFVRMFVGSNTSVRTWSLENRGGTGVASVNHPEDLFYQGPKSCGTTRCGDPAVRECLDRVTASQARRPYEALGDNSNAFARKLAACGVAASPLASELNAPGWNYGQLLRWP